MDRFTRRRELVQHRFGSNSSGSYVRQLQDGTLRLSLPACKPASTSGLHSSSHLDHHSPFCDCVSVWIHSIRSGTKFSLAPPTSANNNHTQTPSCQDGVACLCVVVSAHSKNISVFNTLLSLRSRLWVPCLLRRTDLPMFTGRAEVHLEGPARRMLLGEEEPGLGHLRRQQSLCVRR